MSNLKKSQTSHAGFEEMPEKSVGCTHHWIIDPPNGAVSHGRCRLCGADKEFRNSYEFSSWHGLRSSRQAQQRTDKH